MSITIDVLPASLTLTGQPISPAAGAPPISIPVTPAYMTLATQLILPQVSNLDPVEILINPANLYLNAQPFMVEITGPGQLIGLSQPGTITLATTNHISGDGSHFHEIVASSNPGAAEALLKTAEDGSLDLTNLRLAGNLAVNGGDITSSGNMAISPGGTLALNAWLQSDLIASLTDTYDLGSEFKLWRKAFVSEMQAVLFVENTISAIGGRFLIPHGQGTLGDDVDATQTQVDFGQSMSTNDFVVMRGLSDAGLPKVEYLKINSLATGTIYNVSRNVDGSGANSWPEGHVYIVYGNTGDGRIELDAQTAGPRISVLEQGATYNAQTERVRLGDMAGWKSGVTGYGIGIGDPAGTHLYYTPTSGLVIAGNGSGITNINGGHIQTGTITATQIAANAVTATKINVTTLSAIAANLGTVTAGHISGVTIDFGNGAGTMDTDGITMLWGAETDYESQVKWKNTGGSYVARIAALESGHMLIRSEDVITLQTPSATFFLNNGKVISASTFESLGTGRFYQGLYLGPSGSYNLSQAQGNLYWSNGTTYWNITGETGWSNLSLLNGWADYDPWAWPRCAYFKDGHGVVHLKGMARNGTSGHIATLPAGYRPERNEIHNGNAVSTPVRVTVQMDGKIIISNYSPTWSTINGITFKAL